MIREHRYCVYILTNFTHTVLYIGVTNDLVRRLFQHATGYFESFTKRYHVTTLVYWEEFTDVNAAIAREKQIKGGSRRRKIKLIQASNPFWRDLRNDLV